MPRSYPDSTLLLKAAVKFLEQELMPVLKGYHNFQTRVTANALKIVQRELELRGQQEVEEHRRLAAILGHDSGDVDAMSRELALQIRDKKISIDDPALRAHVRQSLADALAINNPKWLER